MSVSEHSSGPIDDSETLIRILVARQHIDKKGRPKAAALTDAERGGLSVFRQSQVKDCEIRAVAEVLVAKARLASGLKGGVFGVLLIKCDLVRAFQRDGETSRCYCVYDTALNDSPAHAEIFQQVANIGDPIRDERRRQLFALVKETFVSVKEFRDGLLLDLAPQTP